MDMYQHDSGVVFLFVLRGELIGDRVRELEEAWNTAKSVLKGKELVVDVSGVTNADAPGVNLLSRMRESGARVTPARPAEPADVLRSGQCRWQRPGRSDGTLFSKILHGFREACGGPIE